MLSVLEQLCSWRHIWRDAETPLAFHLRNAVEIRETVANRGARVPALCPLIAKRCRANATELAVASSDQQTLACAMSATLASSIDAQH